MIFDVITISDDEEEVQFLDHIINVEKRPVVDLTSSRHKKKKKSSDTSGSSECDSTPSTSAPSSPSPPPNPNVSHQPQSFSQTQPEPQQQSHFQPPPQTHSQSQYHQQSQPPPRHQTYAPSQDQFQPQYHSQQKNQQQPQSHPQPQDHANPQTFSQANSQPQGHPKPQAFSQASPQPQSKNESQREYQKNTPENQQDHSRQPQNYPTPQQPGHQHFRQQQPQQPPKQQEDQSVRSRQPPKRPPPTDQDLMVIKKETGNKHFRCNAFNDAIRYYREAAEIAKKLNNPEMSAILHFNLAMSYDKLGAHNQAADECAMAVKLNDNYIKAHVKRAEIFMSQGKYEEAVICYEHVCELDSTKKDDAMRRIEYAKGWSKRAKKRDQHDILGLKPHFSLDDLRAAYKQKARAHHPDKHSDADVVTRRIQEKIFKETNEAYSFFRKRFV